MLSGNVTALFADGNLTIEGDSDDNNIVVLTTIDGVIVRGLDGTTVNGANGDALLIPNADAVPGSLFVSMHDGNDRVHLDGVNVNADVGIVGGSGNDEVGLTSLSIDRHLRIRTDSGDDVVVLNDISVARQTDIRTSNGDDLVTIQDSDLARNLIIKTGSGSDSVALQTSSIQRKTKVWLGSGDDDLSLLDSDLGRRLKVVAGSGDDLIEIDGSTVTRKTKLLGRKGADAVLINGTSSLGRRFVVRGGTGIDSTEFGPDVERSQRRRIRNVESDIVDPTLAAERIDDPTTGLLTKAAAAQNRFPSITDVLEITIGSTVVDSNGVVIVNDATLQFNVTGTPGVVVEVDTDDDGQFNDGTVTLDSQGMGLLETTLLHNDANLGLNNLKIRGVENGVPLDSPLQEFDIHYAIGTVVRYTTDLGAFDVELLENDAPLTVQNFLNYDARLDGSIIHRSAQTQNGGDFIVQGGGFSLVPPLQPITIDAAVSNEFDVNNSNVRGTLSMALPANSPNAGTSQWFFNTADNSFLDAQQHTVFGRVIGTGMNIVDAIHGLQTFNLIGTLGNGALGEVPLENFTPFTESLSGTMTTVLGSTTVVGVGTLFTTEVRIGATIEIDEVVYTISQILSDTQLTLQTNAPTSSTGETGFINAQPDDADYVRLDVNVLLTSIP